MLTGKYLEFYRALGRVIPPQRLIHDPLRTLAYGTDASFYRLVPKLVVKVESEEEIVTVLKLCRSMKIPSTFRAGGTSLSGQSISDSVLVMLGTRWKAISISKDGEKIRLQPGVIGSHANLRLLPFRRKIGPDPASINSAMIGGIAANNSSGMCCGTAQNSYHTLESMRLVFLDGAILDTGDPESRKHFAETHPDILRRIQQLVNQTQSNTPLAERIRRKYKMKNTTGYSLNALVDFSDPIDVIEHLLIGSEGTLAFISEITYRTVPDHPYKATSLILFPDVRTACEAATELRNLPVAAVEIMDRASLRSIEGRPGMPAYLKKLEEAAAALLVETRAQSSPVIGMQVEAIRQGISHLPTLLPVEFTQDKKKYTELWNIRKGLFPSVGAIREIGTTVIIEDVAFPIERLAEATLDLQALFNKHEYSQAIIFGHALEGNLHFVFTQDFNRPEEVSRYQKFLDDLTVMVVDRYDGSLKAEHGTGRNMAPFVELEWGREAYELMKEIKQIFDPENLLNPGVILNADPLAHVKDLKPLPKAHPIVDRCIECGFCEVNCPSRDLSLTPRQRIVLWREISQLESAGNDQVRLAALKKGFAYQGEQTCATDGLCATSCPVDIDTGKLIKALRAVDHSNLSEHLATLLAKHMGTVVFGIRQILNLVDMVHVLLGTPFMERLTSALRKISGNRLPSWNSYLPRAAGPMRPAVPNSDNPLKVVYFPSCISRTMGLCRSSQESESQNRRTDALLRKAGYEVIYPSGLAGLCCGMPFASKGFIKQGDEKAQELITSLQEASAGGRYPILFDTSPCLYRLKEMALGEKELEVYEPVEFVLRFLAARLTFKKISGTVAMHVTCSSRKMGLEEKCRELAELCAEKVVLPYSVGCCGFAGDRGFSTPELTASALSSLKESLPQNCSSGYSTSRTCEIGLSLHSGVEYQSILGLVNQCTEPLLVEGDKSD
ncbi:MAG: FAD-binding and (Fe-S)-binding domain-containing protein [Terriglobia bacterium]